MNVKFVIGFLLAIFAVVGLVGVAFAECPCNQDPTVFGGGWGVTPSTDLSSISMEWQRDILVNKEIAQHGSSLFYMNPAAREAAMRINGDFSNRPVFHEDWYVGNPRYFSDVQWKEYIRGGSY